MEGSDRQAKLEKQALGGWGKPKVMGQSKLKPPSFRGLGEADG